MNINFNELKNTTLFNNSGTAVGPAVKSGTVKGGKAFLKTEKGLSVFSVIQKGKGLLGVMADSHIFTNPQMGGTQITPSKKRLRIYELEFFLIKQLERQP